MTNRFDAYPEPLAGGCYRVMLRFAKDGEPKPLLERGDTPRIFQTEKEAWKASTESLVAYMNGNLRSEIMADQTTPADALFPSLKPIRRNGRVIPVTTNKRARA